MAEPEKPEAALAPAEKARRLIRTCDRASLASAQHDASGWPYASLVICASDHDGAPILLLSDLAEHTKNIKQDPQVSLLFDGTVGLDDPLTGARVTVLGSLSVTQDEGIARRFLARHPSAAGYAGFADFHFYRLETVRAHLVAGFGAIDWIDAGALLYDTEDAKALAEAEFDIVEHMNQDHADALDDYARHLLDLPGAGWAMTGIDPEGFDMRCDGATARLDFETPVDDATGARQALIGLVQKARTRAKEATAS